MIATLINTFFLHFNCQFNAKRQITDLEQHISTLLKIEIQRTKTLLCQQRVFSTEWLVTLLRLCVIIFLVIMGVNVLIPVVWK